MSDYDSDIGDTPTLGVFGVFVIALVGGAITTLMWSGSLRRVSAAAAWPSVQGTVTASGVYAHDKHSPLADSIADVEYTVNGQKHESFAEEVAFDVPTSSARPTVRSLIPVYYDPADPSRCTLINAWQPRHTRRLWFILGPCIVVVVTFPILAYRFYRATQGELIVDD